MVLEIYPFIIFWVFIRYSFKDSVLIVIMASIRELEKMLRPYEIGGAASSAFTMYTKYSRGGITSRLDTEEWQWAQNAREIYKKSLMRVATELGVLQENNLWRVITWYKEKFMPLMQQPDYNAAAKQLERLVRILEKEGLGIPAVDSLHTVLLKADKEKIDIHRGELERALATIESSLPAQSS